MLWVLLAILAAVFYAAGNLIDKHVLDHELRDPILATVVSGLMTSFILMIVALFVESVIVPALTGLVAMVAGVLATAAVWLYYYAISKEEVSRFVPLLSLIPLFVLLLGFLFLGERFSLERYIGVFFVVAGSFAISFKRSKIANLLFVAVIASLLFAVRNLIIKIATDQASLWPVFFWMGVGGAIVSVVLLAYHHPHVITKAKKGINHLLWVGVFVAVGLLLMVAAISMGPVSLVIVLMEFQALFVFVAATFLSLLYPNIIKEKITRKILVQKSFAIAALIIGAVLVI